VTRTVMIDRGDVRVQFVHQDGTKTDPSYVEIVIRGDEHGPNFRLDVKQAEDLSRTITEVLAVVKR